MVYVIINEQHQLTDEQKELIRQKLGNDFTLFKVPAKGWTKKEIFEVAKELAGETVVFVSPVPLLLGLLCYSRKGRVFLFHNDHREKKELPNGKVIYVVPQTGWELIEI